MLQETPLRSRNRGLLHKSIFREKDRNFVDVECVVFVYLFQKKELDSELPDLEEVYRVFLNKRWAFVGYYITLTRCYVAFRILLHAKKI